MENILKKIISKKKEKIVNFKKEYSENKILENIKKMNNFFDFKGRIKRETLKKKISIIAEIIKASPSAGEIVKNFDPENIEQTTNEQIKRYQSLYKL